jgi:hypothetical protein
LAEIRDLSPIDATLAQFPGADCETASHRAQFDAVQHAFALSL